MDFDKVNNQKKIAEIKAKKQEKELEKLVNLADKKIGWIVFGGLLFPISAYIYTGRWKGLFIALGCVFSLLIVFALAGLINDEDDADAFGTGLGIGLIIYGLQDNIFAVTDARKRIKELS